MPFLTVAILLIVPLVSGKIYPNNFTDFIKCTVHYSRDGNSYKDFFEIADIKRDPNDTLVLDFHFSVLAPSNAHILLTSKANPNKKDPVYEIVLGAGGNSFSDIRRGQKASVLETVRQNEGILSALDVQSFWIHINKEGLIEVGKEGEELAFINVRDLNPLSIKFFAFGTWDGVEAKWFYDCPRENKIQHSKNVRVLSNLERLRNDLLDKYDPYVRPSLDPHKKTVVAMNLHLLTVDLDEKRSILNIKTHMQLSWIDQKTVWNPKMYGNESKLILFGRQIWRPDLVLYNAASLIQNDFLNDGAMMVVKSNGSVSWKPLADLNVRCDASNLGHWPSDVHSCNVSLGFWRDSNNLQLHVENLNGENIKFLRWDVTDIQVYYATSDRLQFISDVSDQTQFLILQISIKRNSKFFDATFMAPFLVIALSMLLTFIVSPFGLYKISLCCFQFILTTLCLIALGNVIPSHPTNVPYYVVIYSSSYVASLFCVFISLIVINLSRYEHKHAVPHCLWQTITLLKIQKILLLPKIEMTKQYGNIVGTVKKIDENVQDTWIFLGNVIDRIALIIYFILIVLALMEQY